MTHPSFVSNGASLEDSHTNFFALTDLCGIKWRRLFADGVLCLDSEPLEDPVLSSYSKCLAAGLLCVWRKVPSKSGHSEPHRPRDNNQHNFSKELWIFWYGEEPDLSNLVSGLTEGDPGSLENGLSYECRTLLFKAFHNLIERCLLSRGFTRLGKWFIQPLDDRDRLSHSWQFSFAFNFFVHGESTVCTSVDVRHPPAVYRLAKQHLQAVQTHQSEVTVILSPYGLAGTLTGQTYKENDPETQQLLVEWQQFYPLGYTESYSDDDLPCLVEVKVAGVKMKYPSCYVFITESDEAVMTNFSQGGAPAASTHTPSQPFQKSNGLMDILTPPTSPCDTSCLASTLQMTPNCGVPVSGCVTHIPSHQLPFFPEEACTITTHRLKSGAWQDNIMHHHPPVQENSEPEDSCLMGQWNFNEPCSQIGCFCFRCKTKMKSSSGKPGLCSGVTNSVCANSINSSVNNCMASNPTSVSRRGDKEKGQQRSRGIVPYHKRNTLSDHTVIESLDSPATVVSSEFSGMNSNCMFVTKNTGVIGEVPTTLPQLQTSLGQLVAIESSHPGTSLYHEGITSQSSSSDPAMPTLSPHPPVVKDDPETKQQNHYPQSPAVVTAISLGNTPKEKYAMDQVLQSPYHNPLVQFDNHRVSEALPTTSYCNLSADDQKSSQSALLIFPPHVSPHPKVSAQVIKRPVLSIHEEEDMEEVEFQRRKCLYDFSSLHNTTWEPDEKKRKQFICSLGSEEDGVSGDSFQQCLKGQPKESAPQTSKPKDPYEFSDEFEEQPSPSSGGSSFRSRVDLFIKEEEKPKEPELIHPPPVPLSGDSSKPSVISEFSSVTSPPTPRLQSTSFTREEDLQVTEHDLENIFEMSSSEDSNDELFQHPATPNSVKMMNHYEEQPVAKCNKDNTLSVLGSADLIRMFPTPPSLEHHVTPSPSGPVGIVDGTLMDGNDSSTLRDRIDVCPNYESSGMFESIRDWSYVYKPVVQYKMLGSMKYSTVNNLPSSTLPPLNLPPEMLYKPSFVMHLNSHTGIMHRTCETVSDKHISSYHQSLLPPSEPFMVLSEQRSFPLSYELQSPASNSSSYLNKHLGSIDNSTSAMPEANSLVVNLALSDSMLNFYKDHNFSSCTVCVCNMNIKGTDMGLYLFDSMVPQKNDEPQYKCTCGFSAVINRHLGYNSGLFYEDEVEITGYQKEPINRHHQRLKTAVKQAEIVGGSSISPEQLLEKVPQDVLDLVQSQCSVLQPSSSWLFTARQFGMESQTAMCNTLQILDGCAVCLLALEAGHHAMDSENTARIENKFDCLHRWPYVPAKLPASNYDIVRLFKMIQPLLQDAVQKKTMQGMWEVTYTVSGPLTWRQFHRLAGRVGASTEDQCEPQPIPSLLVGYDKDWLAVSPFALKLWDKLLLEPYSLPRDIAYVVVAPDSDFILNRVRFFFKELSSMYELCRLGRHSPITKVLRDGIMRVGKSAARKLADEPVDEWFNLIGNGPVASKLKLYAQVCRHHLAPYLATQFLDKATFSRSSSVNSKSQSETSPLSSSYVDSHQEKEHSSRSQDSDSQQEISGFEPLEQENGQQHPALVVYLIEPFTFGNPDSYLYRLSSLGLLLCYRHMLHYLPESICNSIQVQIVRLDSILSMGKPENFSQHQYELKALAFSVYSQCRRLLSHPPGVKSLTGFGPAAAQEQFQKQRKEKISLPRKLFSPPFILASMKDKQTELGEMFGDRREKSSILYCCYCPTEDHRWLLGCITTDKGDLLENCCININIPDRPHRKKASSRRTGLHKLLDFILGVMSNSCEQWRLVVGRLGRLGHGELKDWATLLSRKYLLRYSRQLRELCSQCAVLNPLDASSILSACLVSLEPDSSLRIMPDQYTPDNRFGSSSRGCELSTPEDASCTQILVYPTSATTQSSQATFHQEHIDSLGPSFGDDDFFQALEIPEEQVITDLITWTESPTHSPVGSPRRDLGSPGGGVGRHSPLHHNGPIKNSSRVTGEHQEEPLQLLQQPLALGYYVSTAKTGPLPGWFWSPCPHLKDACPVFLKSALHIHSTSVQQSSDELLHNTQHVRNCHPLDSNLTTDVLRYVLEGYNALSWLSLDPVTHDRQSCLPIHIQVLMQQYHAAEAIL
ncbi:mediator of RNA polymerase II transcription subunit 13-like [Limulus polyphemus]|uniref:Mediator of RNA polymerase II transcription subunit 13 n=1 Tax=Limulus polyphemus TaxID=6850 RepID=A0ABM1BFZ3_LIMPO|nr:mediator of RNA polymerase II transcription subunit 13-like [Limulus polyphemus]